MVILAQKMNECIWFIHLLLLLLFMLSACWLLYECFNFPFIYNFCKSIIDNFTKLSSIGFSIEYFTTDFSQFSTTTLKNCLMDVWLISCHQLQTVHGFSVKFIIFLSLKWLSSSWGNSYVHILAIIIYLPFTCGKTWKIHQIFYPKHQNYICMSESNFLSF